MLVFIQREVPCSFKMTEKYRKQNPPPETAISVWCSDMFYMFLQVRFRHQVNPFSYFHKLVREVKRETNSPVEHRSPVEQELPSFDSVSTALESSQKEYGAKLGKLV